MYLSKRTKPFNLSDMKMFAKLIHKSYMSFLRTMRPVHFYGLPDNKVYLFYERAYCTENEKIGIDFVFAVHQDFSFNYSLGEIVPKEDFRAPVYNEMVDNPDPNVEIIEVRNDVKTYKQALAYLNQVAEGLKEKSFVLNGRLSKGVSVAM